MPPQVAKDNNKETDDSKRQFILDAEQPFELITGEPDAGGNSYQELVCRFEFRPATVNDWEDSVKARATAAAKKTTPTQAHLIDIAEVLLLGDASDLPSKWKAALQKPYVKANGEKADYSTLKGQLNNYTKKNRFDYFIHKDLGGFLTRELDFYIKNELMQWEDIVALKNNPARLAPMLSKLDVIRDLGGKIIAFLAQLEDFQKKLWLKKKFVTETNYCITLDRVPEPLYPAICANPAQHDEWVKLFAIDEIKADLATAAYSNPLTEDFLHANQNLVLDTQFFDEAFKAELIASIEDFDEQCDGLLVHSENFQALNLLQERYKEKVKCIYIDPPYNTGDDGFSYRDNYRHSSWISFISDRTKLSKSLLGESGISFISISDEEQAPLKFLLDSVFGDNYIGTIQWNSTKSVTNTALISVGHTHNYIYANDRSYFTKNRVHFRLPDSADGFSNPDNDPRGPWKADPFQVGGERPNQLYEITNPKTGVTYRPNPGSSWKNDFKTFKHLLSDDRIVFGVTGEAGPQRKRFWNEAEARGRVAKTWWDDVETTTNGTRLLNNIFGFSIFTNPKPVGLLVRFLQLGLYKNNQLVLDYFSGSGGSSHLRV